MKKEERLIICEAPAKRPTPDQHRSDRRLYLQTRHSIMTRLKSFAQEFERLAETAKQGVQAERFMVEVKDIAGDYPLTAADFSRHMSFPTWLKGQARQFEQLATTTPQKVLASSFREFAREVGSPAVKEIFQKPLVNELVQDIKAWMEGSSNGVPFAELSQEGKRQLLGVGIDWTDYIDRGLAFEGKKTWAGIESIIDNAIAGKPSEQWTAGAQNPAKGDEIRRLLTAQRQPQKQDQQRQCKPKGRDLDMDRG